MLNATSRRFTPWKETRCPLFRRLGGPQGRSGLVRKISSPPGFDPRTVQTVASRYTDWAIPVHKRFKKAKYSSSSVFAFLRFVWGLSLPVCPWCVKLTGSPHFSTLRWPTLNKPYWMWWGAQYCVALLHVCGDVNRCTLFTFRNFITDNVYLQALFIIFHAIVRMALQLSSEPPQKCCTSPSVQQFFRAPLFSYWNISIFK